MKTQILTLALSSILGLGTLNAQNSDNKQIEKQIEVTINDSGEKEITVTTTTNGTPDVVVYTDEEADNFLEQEHANMLNNDENMSIDIDIDIDEILEAHGISKEDGEVIVKRCMKNMDGKEGDVIWIEESENGEDGAHVIMKKMCHPPVPGMEHKSKKVINEVEVYDDIEEAKAALEEMEIEIGEMPEDAKKVIVKQVVIIETDDEPESRERKVQKQQRVKHANNKSDLMLYPNPNSGEFTLEFDAKENEKSTITVTDVQGKEIYKETVKGKTHYKLPIELDNNAKGAYIVKIKQGNEVKAQKILLD